MGRSGLRFGAAQGQGIGFQLAEPCLQLPVVKAGIVKGNAIPGDCFAVAPEDIYQVRAAV